MNDEKTAADYKVSGGSVLHLVLALKKGKGQKFHPFRTRTSWHSYSSQHTSQEKIRKSLYVDGINSLISVFFMAFKINSQAEPELKD